MIPSVLETANVDAGGCDCCRLSPAETPESYGCTDRKEVFTAREQEVLKRIREAGERARNLKKQLDGPEGSLLDSSERERIGEELKKLRQARMELENERMAAAEERMRYLGHA